MKRLDVNVTDSLNEVLENLKRRTERSKTELVHDAIGLLWLAEKAYAKGNAIAEINPVTGEIVSRFHMAMFEHSTADQLFDEDLPRVAAALNSALLARTDVPIAKLREESQLLAGMLQSVRDAEQKAGLAMKSEPTARR